MAKKTFKSIIDATAGVPPVPLVAVKKNNLKNWFDPISVAVIIGTFGLIFGVLLFTTGSSIYGEIGLIKKPLMDTLLADRLTCLDKTIQMLDKKIQPNLQNGESLSTASAKSEVPDSVKEWFKAVNNAWVAIKTTHKELLALDKGNSDTSLLYFNKFITVDRAQYLGKLDSGVWLNSKENIKYLTVHATLIDTCRACQFYPAFKAKTLTLIQNKRSKAIDFFKDYPQFGLWIVFSIAQMVLWFMIIPLLAGNVAVLNDKLGNVNYMIKFGQVIRNTVLPLVLVAAFCYLFYNNLLDKWLITDNYFLNGFSTRVLIYAVFGYAIAGCCFGTYITLTHKLDQINADVKDKITRLDSPHLNDSYLALKSAFDSSFYCSALILSFVVFWTGILVNAVNSTEGMRFYFDLSGKYFIPNDFVYLLGLMHSLILLIFYVPVKLKFNNLAITQVAPTVTSPSVSIFSALSNSIGPLLVTVSPLLASLVHSLFGLVSKT